MEAARRQRLKHEAFCRYHLGLSMAEIKSMSAAQIVALEAVWREDRKQFFEFFEKLTARVLLFGYMLNTPKEKVRYRRAKDFMYFGESPKNSKPIDLKTKDGQELLYRQFLGLTAGRKSKNG